MGPFFNSLINNELDPPLKISLLEFPLLGSPT